MTKLLALLLFVVCTPLQAATQTGDSFEYGGIQQDYGVDLIANSRDGALSIAVSAKEIRHGQVDDNGVVVAADNRLLQFSVMRAGSASGKVISDIDPRQILEAHRRSRVSFIETLTKKPVASQPGVFKTIEGKNFYFWSLDTGPAAAQEKAEPNKAWRHLHATAAVGDLVAILIVPLTSADNEDAAQEWLAKTAATLTVHNKPFVHADTAAETAK